MAMPCYFTDSALISSSLSTHVYTDHVDSGGKGLNWPDIGFELIIPHDAVPEFQTIRIAVIPSQTSPFPLPSGMELASLVYLVAVSPEMKFLKYVGLSLKHRANLETRRASLGMTFVAVAHNHVQPSARGRPQLRPLEGGQFIPKSDMASIALDSFFPVLAIAQCTQHKPIHKGTCTHTDSIPERYH